MHDVADPHDLVDPFGRTIRDLRISVTDRCNFRCTYCMPAEGLPWLPKPEMLTDEEIVRLVGVFVGLGIRQVRLTGGEPLLRRSLVDVVRGIASLDPRPRIAMTTNGVGLDRLAEPLRAAGLDRVNVSLDTIDADEFAALTRRDRLHDVEAGLKAAAATGLEPVKVNAVAMRGVNDSSVAELLQWCLDRGYELRFIEQMPLDAQHGWDRATMITADEIHELLDDRFGLTPTDPSARGSAPAESFLVRGGPQTVGIIASVTRPFCGDCDRVRLTADGQVRDCQFARTESDLRTALRAGADDDELADRWRRAMRDKLPGHGINDPSFLQPTRPMSAIGG